MRGSNNLLLTSTIIYQSKIFIWQVKYGKNVNEEFEAYSYL